MKSDLPTNAKVIARVKEEEVLAGSLAAEIILVQKGGLYALIYYDAQH